MWTCQAEASDMIPRPEQKRYLSRKEALAVIEAMTVAVLWCMTDDPETKAPAEQPLSLEATRVIDAQKVRDSEQYNKGWEDAARHYDEATGVG